MDLRTGLNPYGLTYYLGLQGAGTPRANPDAKGLEGYIALATELGARSLELWDGWIKPMSDAELAALKLRLNALDMEPVLSAGLQTVDIENLSACSGGAGGALRQAGDDADPLRRPDRRRRRAGSSCWRAATKSSERYAPLAKAAGVTLLIENHQDFTSRELVDFCETYGESVRIVFDTANSFPVAESPLDFARVIAPYVRYVHAKDYRVQFTDEGIRLVRCPTGDGAVPFREVFDILGEHNRVDARRDRDRCARGPACATVHPGLVAGLCAQIGRGAGGLPAGGAAQSSARRPTNGGRRGSATPTANWQNMNWRRCGGPPKTSKRWD